jgi:signal recognition particle receptor subunit alpha
MLDAFEVLTTSGVVVWSRTYAPVSPSIVNNFIADTFIEEKKGGIAPTDSQSAATNPAYKSDQHTLKWTFVKELGLIFVVWEFPVDVILRRVFILTTVSLYTRLYTALFYTSHGSISWWITSKPSLSSSTAISSPNPIRPSSSATRLMNISTSSFES